MWSEQKSVGLQNHMLPKATTNNPLVKQDSAPSPSGKEGIGALANEKVQVQVSKTGMHRSGLQMSNVFCKRGELKMEDQWSSNISILTLVFFYSCM